MGSQRVFEIANEYKISSEDLIRRMSSIGVPAENHLTTLDAQSVEMVKQMLRTAPAGDVIEKRVNKTVRRRRSKRPKVVAVAPPAPLVVAPPAPVAVASPEPPHVPVAVVRAEPVVAPELVAAPIETAPAERTPADTAPVAEVPASGPEATVTAAVIEPVAEAPATAGGVPTEPVLAAPTAPAEATAAGETAGEPGAADAAALTEVVLPSSPTSKPTSTQAVVVTRQVDRRILEAVQRTRQEKGYDRPSTDPRNVDHPRPAPGGAPGATPTDRRPEDRTKKKKGGRRLVIDNRRDRLVRRGMLDHDQIFRGGRGKKKRTARGRSGPPVAPSIMKVEKRVVKMGAAITVGNLAQQLMVKSTAVIGKLMQLGVMATVNQSVDFDTATMIADEFGWRVESQAFDLSDYIEDAGEEARDDLESRPPVVTVMGHVDHGKTSLLDHIRKAKVASGEAGGITQHIGAYTVDLGGRGTVVFIDTPGHEAFTAMRARGSKATDIVILVVAADDGVMPQTIESINHARAAKVPIVVAVNKIDKNNANPDRVLTELSEHGLVAEQWGGDTVVCQVSALRGDGIDNLLEMLLIQAELMELSAPAQVPAHGLVLEARLEKGRGPVATLLVKEGTLSVGDIVVSGKQYGRVRAMTNDKGKRVKKATPSTPIEVVGLSGVPDSSEPFHVVKDDKAAKKIVDHRTEQARAEVQLETQGRMSLDKLTQMLAAGEVRELNLIVKADVHGSAEALKDALVKLSRPEVGVKVLHSAVGGITESDVRLASASNAVIIGFSVRPEAKAKRLAERENVELKLYSIIYDALDEVKLAMAGLLAPVEKENILGHAVVRATFGVPKVGTVAGSYVEEGTVSRSAKVRLVRDSVTVYTGHVTSLRRFKDDVREVKAGYECGIGIGYNDIKEGDTIEFFEIEQVAATLD